MIQHWSQKIADYLISQEVIDKDEFDIYVYGYETALSGIIDFLMISIIGWFTHQLHSTLVFFVMFVSIRLYVGGYHAKTYFQCKIMFISIYLLVIFLSNLYLPIVGIVIALVSYLITVICFAPIENINKPLDDSEKKKYRKIGIVLSILWSCAAIPLYFFNNTLSLVIVYTALFIALLMVISVAERRKNNEKGKCCS